VLKVDALTLRVVGALAQHGVSPIVLKGPAVGRWIYSEIGERQYSDTDLLVSPAARPAAEAVLRDLGFEPVQSGWLSKSRSWRSGRGHVDLHTSLFGIEVDDATAWEMLSADTESLAIGRTTVEVLSPAGRALHLATHAAQHDRTFPRPHADLERAVTILAVDVWREAASLSYRLRATRTFVAGLRRVGADVLLEQLGLEAIRPPVATVLLAADPPPTALGISQLAAAPTMRSRLRVLARGLIPQRGYMHAQYPVARRGRSGLTLAYALRIAHLIRYLPRGLRACYCARRIS
jgi:Uncharacterised nucleotidyltransferase